MAKFFKDAFFNSFQNPSLLLYSWWKCFMSYLLHDDFSGIIIMEVKSPGHTKLRFPKCLGSDCILFQLLKLESWSYYLYSSLLPDELQILQMCPERVVLGAAQLLIFVLDKLRLKINLGGGGGAKGPLWSRTRRKSWGQGGPSGWKPLPSCTGWKKITFFLSSGIYKIYEVTHKKQNHTN